MSGGSGRPVSLRRGKKRQLDEAEIRNLTLHEDNEEVVQGEIQGEIQEVDLRYVQLLFFVVMNVFFFRTLLEICPNESGGFADESKFKYRKNEDMPQSLLAMMKKLRMTPVFVRQLMEEILTVTVSF